MTMERSKTRTSYPMLQDMYELPNGTGHVAHVRAAQCCKTCGKTHTRLIETLSFDTIFLFSLPLCNR